METKKQNSLFKTTLLLIPYIWMHNTNIRVRIVVSLLLAIVMIALNLSIPYMFKLIVDNLEISHTTSFKFISFILLGYGLCWLLSQIISHLRELLIFKVLERGMRLLSLNVLDHLLSLSMNFHVNRKTGTITNYFDRAHGGFDNIFWGLISYLIPTILEMSIVIFIISYFYSILYGSLLVFILVSYLFFSFSASGYAIKLQDDHNEKHAKASAYLVETMLNIETIKYFGNQGYEHSKANNLLKEVETAGIKRYSADIFLKIAQNLIIGVGFIFITWLSGRAVYSNSITLGDFVLINGYLLQFISPLSYLSYIMKQIQKGIQDVSAILNIMRIKPEITDASNAIDLKIDKADVVFENVNFGYTPERLIIKDLSFHIPAGKTFAIVGPSGSGKSTISKLLFRFYDVNTGQILINGQNIKNIKRDALCKIIGIVPQDAALFNDTIYNNLLYARPTAPEDEIKEAVHLAHLDNTMRAFPDGLNTQVGERGAKLSGGEKQRVSIARILIKKPAMYIFDEATSALDTSTEKDIQKNLEEISKGITTLIIAHRLSTIIHADQIIVLNKGEIAEQGTHHELLAKNGIYAQMWNKQSKN
ncbi:MAG: ABC transporter transmembrane domain-containing protein [Candidatus Babeliales bacterium]|nr:ABC transporter transmembrane domain-containing protein [Candidatus Babeliales bacterium]